MAEPLTLLEFVKALFTNPQLRDFYESNPQAALGQCGLGHMSPPDVADALQLVRDSETHDYTAPATPRVEYVDKHVTNEYVDDRKVLIDKSIHQNIDTGGEDLYQSFDDHSAYAIGDGSVAAAGDIDGSKIVTGDDNQLGNGNIKGNQNVTGKDNDVINGHGNTGGFGDGAVNNTDVDGSVKLEDGAAFGNGGTVGVNNADSSTNHSGNQATKTELDNVGNNDTDNSQQGSHNTDTHTTSETDYSETDSHNTHESHANHTQDTTSGSHNVDYHV